MRQRGIIWQIRKGHITTKIARAVCMVDKYGYRHTLRVCNTRFCRRLIITFAREWPVSLILEKALNKLV